MRPAGKEENMVMVIEVFVSVMAMVIGGMALGLLLVDGIHNHEF